MTFILLLIIAFMIGYIIMLHKEYISIADEISRCYENEIEMVQLEKEKKDVKKYKQTIQDELDKVTLTMLECKIEQQEFLQE